MLEWLRIENLALVKQLELNFNPGFTVFTGETGAGKSLILEALNILAGSRLDRAFIRDGAHSCTVEAQINLANDQAVNIYLEEAGLPPCQDGVLVLKRILYTQKSARNFINGALSTGAVLQKLGPLWIEFHGPQEPQKLFEQPYQLEMLDCFAETHSQKIAYTEQYNAWRALKKELHTLETQERLPEQEQFFIEKELEKMGSLDLSSGGIESLEADFKRLQQMENISDNLQTIRNLFYTKGGILDYMHQIQREAQKFSQKEPLGESLQERLASALIELDDLANDYTQLENSFHFDSVTASKIESHMQTWLALKHHYGLSLDSVLAKREYFKARLARQGTLEFECADLKIKIKATEEKLMECALALQKARKSGAKRLEAAIYKQLGVLGLASASFSVAFIKEPSFKEHGSEHIQFLFSSTPDNPVWPLDKVASGGELARVLLALKAVLAEQLPSFLLVFDEIDANVGGEMAKKMAEVLLELSARHQVFCITHLPQVAAKGDMHFLVRKEERDKKTEISITPLEQERLNELTRMLGDRHSTSARKHAETLLA